MRNLEELLDIKSVTIAGEEYEIDVDMCVEVDQHNLKTAFENHTKLMVLVGFAFERALSHAKQLEVECERLYAMCDARARNDAAVSGVKMTEKMVENSALTAAEYQEHQNKLLTAQKEMGLLKALKEGMIHRKDMLVGLGATYRSELAAEPTLRY